MNTVDIQKWHTLSIEEQFGNIGSEVSRVLRARGLHNPEREMGAFSRMIDLFMASKSDTRWHRTGAMTELCRAQEVVCDYFYGDNLYGTTEKNICVFHFSYSLVPPRRGVL